MTDYKKYTREELAHKAFAVIADIGFFIETVGQTDFVVAVNLNNPTTTLILNKVGDTFQYEYDCMSRENRYIVLYIVEKNKNILLEGFKTWESMQHIQ